MHALRLTIIRCLALAFSLGGVSCTPERDAALTSPASAARPDGSKVIQLAYERGPWRLASAAELNRTVLWLSHILIRHAESDPDGSPLRSFGWSPEAPSTRSVEDARQLTERVAALAHENPARFEALAAEHSEDELTRARGGALGAMSASTLPSYFLDAAQQLEAGQISSVVQTPLGFHVLLVRNPPPAQRVSGQRVVIRYKDTRGHGESVRRREEARELAQRVLQEAKAGAPFDALVAKYSESDDRAIGGQLGVWSTREAAPEPIAIEVLSRLEVDAVAGELVESRAGFQVVKRTAVVEEPELAVDAVYFPFDPSAPATQAEARRKAEELIAAAHADPTALDARNDRKPLRWRCGQVDGYMTAAVRPLAAGQIADVPVELNGFYGVVRRAATASSCEPTLLQHELPAPRIASLTLVDDFVRWSQPEQLTYSLGQITPLIGGLLKPEERPIVTAAFGQLAGALKTADTEDKRSAAYGAALGQLAGGLGAARYAVVTGFIQRWVSTELMTVPRP